MIRTINLTDVSEGESIGLRPGMAWALYWDSGPGGPCGQSMRITCEHAALHIFPSEDDMRAAVSAGIGRNKKARVMVGVIGDWGTGEMSVVAHAPRKAEGGA